MADISASLVKELRDETNVGMMECKKALVDAGGDKAKAVQLLRERGLAVASKKASRAANSGIVAAQASADGRSGVMIEVNCETDFVARNDIFKSFVGGLVAKAQTLDGELAPAVADTVHATIQKIGENVVVRRNIKYVAQGPGLIATYVHLGSKLGVMVEIGSANDAAAASPAVQELARDITLHLAACRPPYLDRTAVPQDVIAAERAIYAKQVENKPANIVEKIVDGKIGKYFSTVCLVDQPFVKDDSVTVTKLLAAKSKDAGGELSVRRYAIWQLGE
jgi:elongation factor Ts